MNRCWQISLALLLAFSSGCHKFTTVKPEAKNVAGVYQPTPETLAMFAKQGYTQTNNISISLEGDGKFELRNMPDAWLSSLAAESLPQKSYDSGGGKWAVTDNGADGNNAWGVIFEFQNTTNIISIKRQMKAILVVGGTMFKNEKAPYVLQFFIGDSDSSPLCEFRVGPKVQK
jgi:hypothetical protein